MKRYMYGVLQLVVILLMIRVSTQCDHGEVRLVEGSVHNEGIVEVCISTASGKNWAIVCATYWDGDSLQYSWENDDAMVVCRQLGYTPTGAQMLRYQPPVRNIPFMMSRVNCAPETDDTLLECRHNTYSNAYCHRRAGVRCNVSQRIMSVRAARLDTAVATATSSVEITWQQNTTVAEANIFEVKCYNDVVRHSIEITVSSDTTTTDLGGLLHSSRYTCCVSAVYDFYTARSVCTEVEIPTNNNPQPITREHSTEGSDRMCITGTAFLVENSTDNVLISGADSMSSSHTGSNSTSTTIIVGGVLGFIIILLLVLLAVSVVCLLRQKKVLAEKLSQLVDSSSNSPSTLPVRANVSYLTTPSSRSATENSYQNDRNASAVSNPNYSSIGPAYETLSNTTARQQQQEGGREIPISERYEFAEIHTDTDRRVQVGVSASDYEVPRDSVHIGDSEYSRLQR